MSNVVNVAIHASQFPDAVRRELLESLRQRQVSHKFHYDSLKQTQKWLALHAAYSPSRRDEDCADVYDRGFASAATRISAPRVRVVGLGCGGGQKDARLLKQLHEASREVSYMPCDVSLAMVLVARDAALAAVPGLKCFPLVCDLARTSELLTLVDANIERDTARLLTFFGMIPNFEPGDIGPKLANLVRAEDYLLFSANLAPGTDYAAGVERILPQYDNALTRAWLLTFLLDLGVESADGELRFGVEEDPAGSGLRRIVAGFHFLKARQFQVEGERFEFPRGDCIRLFFSYRYTPGRVRELLARYGLRVVEEWITRSGEEGVFLVRRT